MRTCTPHANIDGNQFCSRRALLSKRHSDMSRKVVHHPCSSSLPGFPSVGKSSLLTILTGTESEAAAYEFTTLTCIPGVIHHNDAKIQLLDLPGIIEGAAEGKGRGRQVSISWASAVWSCCREQVTPPTVWRALQQLRLAESPANP